MIRFFLGLIYDLIYFLVLILASLCKPFLKKKSRDWIELRQNCHFFASSIPQKNKRIWIHASSGEIEYAKSLIREIKNQNADTLIFVSYSSLSAPKLFKNIESDVDYFFPLNWDTKSNNIKLIQKIKPQILIFSRTDFWFNLIRCCEKHHIPMMAISVFPKINRINSLLFKLLLQKFKFISAANEAVAQKLKCILPQIAIEFIPDTRFDQVFHRLHQPPKIQINSVNSAKSLITLGSTWPKDEAILIPNIPDLLNMNFTIVWAPHEILRCDDLIKKIQLLFPQINLLRTSQFPDKQINSSFDILIIDEIGYLADAYRFSKIAFIGGSFVKKVHSVMEPLCAQNIVFVGPFHHNNPEALQFKNMNLVREFKSSTEFLNLITEIQNTPHLYENLKVETEKMIGGTNQNYEYIQKIMMAVGPN